MAAGVSRRVTRWQGARELEQARLAPVHGSDGLVQGRMRKTQWLVKGLSGARGGRSSRWWLRQR